MTSSARDHTTVTPGERWSAEQMESLLSAVASAPDFSTAARFLVAQFAEVSGAERGYVLLIDVASGELQSVATVGYDEHDAPEPHVLDDRHDPLVVAALSMIPVSCPERQTRMHGSVHASSSAAFVALPFPQPRASDAPPFLNKTEAERLLRGGCVLHATSEADAGAGASGAPSARGAHSPCGVVVLEMPYDGTVVAPLLEASLLAGPVLWRIAAIEAHRRSTVQLDEQRNVLTSIVNSLPDPIVIINGEHEIVVQNRRAEHLLSMGEKDSEGRRRAVEINNLLFTSHLSKTAIAPGSSGGAGSRELNMVDPDEGTDLLFEVLTQPLDEVKAGATVSVLRDVTDLRRAAGELERQVQRVRLAEFEAKRERDRLNLILANVADPILVTDDRSNIILMNRQAEQMFGAATPDDGVGAARRSAAVRANDTKFTTFISDFALSQDVARREQMSFLTPDSPGGTVPIEVISGKILDKRGEAIAIVSVLHDLTEQVENERLYEELKNFNNELEARVGAATSDLAEQNVRLQWQSRELEKANRLKSEFLASMSHELRTPINALIGYTALILDRIYGDLNAKQEEGLTRIQAAAQHLLALINDILDLAKIEAGRMPLHMGDISLQDILREVTVHIDPLVKKKGLQYRSTLPDEVVLMHTDRTKVKQIMLNLLSNAVKFTPGGGITLSARREGDFVRIDVADTGIGIRKEDLEAIWEDFRQVDQSRTREFGGTGLGLSITRKLADALGGRVTLTSEYGGGSTVSVFLPVRSEPGQEPGDTLFPDAVGPALTGGG